MSILTLFILLTGLAAFIQVVFLPGWIFITYLRITESLTMRLIFAFGLSLMINYWLIFFLVALHLFIPTTLWSLLLAEIVMLLWLNSDTMRSARHLSVIDVYEQCAVAIQKKTAGARAWIREQNIDSVYGFLVSSCLILACASILYLTYIFVSNLGTVFNLWDPIVSWNRWAVEWSGNAFPKSTWEYPQLIPVNWSIFYVFMGSAVEYFPKAIMPLFELGICTTLLATGIRERSIGYIAAVPATALLTRLLVGTGIMATDGYVDTAVAFFSFVSILILLIRNVSQPSSQTTRYLLLGALFALGAAMTKQAGLFTVVVYPILAWILVLKNNPEIKKRWFKYLIIYIALLFALLGPFYVYKELAIHAQQDTSVAPAILNQLYGGGKGPLQVSGEALYYLVTKSYGLILVYIALSIFAVRKTQVRALLILLVIPWTIIWSIFNSYDDRNLSLTFPFVGLLAGVGFEHLVFRLKDRVTRMLTKTNILWPIFFLVVALIAVSPFVSKKIITQYTSDKREIYDRDLSILLSNYFENHPGPEKIYTDQPLLYFLPATQNRVWSPIGGYTTKGSDFDQYFKNVNDPQVSYIFSTYYADAKIKTDIEQKIKTGEYTLIFQAKGGMLVKINRKTK